MSLQDEFMRFLTKRANDFGYGNAGEMMNAILNGDVSIQKSYVQEVDGKNYDFEHIGVQMCLTSLSLLRRSDGEAKETMLSLEAEEKEKADGEHRARRTSLVRISGEIPVSHIIEMGVGRDLLRVNTFNSHQNSRIRNDTEPSASISPSPEPDEDDMPF